MKFKNWLESTDGDYRTTKILDPNSLDRQMGSPSSQASDMMALQHLRANHRQQLVQSGQASGDLSIFRTYSEIANLIKTIDQANRRHQKIVSMMQKKLPENNSPTTMWNMSNTTSHSQHNLYGIERHLLSIQEQATKNEYRLHTIMSRSGIDIHAHLLKQTGLPGMVPENATLQSSLGGCFKDIDHLASEVNRVGAQTSQISEQVQNLLTRTGGVPSYKHDPASVLD